MHESCMPRTSTALVLCGLFLILILFGSWMVIFVWGFKDQRDQQLVLIARLKRLSVGQCLAPLTAR